MVRSGIPGSATACKCMRSNSIRYLKVTVCISDTVMESPFIRTHREVNEGVVGAFQVIMDNLNIQQDSL